MELLDGDAKFGPSQVGAETEVIPGAKGKVTIRTSIEADTSVYELVRIDIGGAEYDRYLFAGVQFDP